MSITPEKLPYPEVALNDDAACLKGVNVKLFEDWQRNYVITYLDQYDTEALIEEYKERFTKNLYPTDLEQLILVKFDKKEENKKTVFTNQFMEYQNLINKKKSYKRQLSVKASQLLDLKRKF